MRGFTLVEVLVVTALVVVLVLIGTGVFLANNLFYENQTGKVSAVNATREAADRIAQFGRGAESLVSTYTYASITYNTGTGTVIFKLPSLDASDQIISGTYDYAMVTLDPVSPSKLWLIVDANPTSSRPERTLLLTDKLTSINFTYNNPDLTIANSVTYNLVVTSAGRNPATEQVYGRVTLRN